MEKPPEPVLADECVRDRAGPWSPYNARNSTADRNINPNPRFGSTESSSLTHSRGEQEIITGTRHSGKCFHHRAWVEAEFTDVGPLGNFPRGPTSVNSASTQDRKSTRLNSS